MAEAAERWYRNEAPILEHCTPWNIFIVETALFYNAQPKRILETCHGGKKYKCRLTVLVSFTVEGDVNLQPFVTGKFGKPYCIKNIKYCPCEYKAKMHGFYYA
jgi:hypothetical protein